MPDNTYQDLKVGDKKTIQITTYRNNGEAYSPSGAYYKVNGGKRNNPIIPRTAASIDNNRIYTKIGPTITASAGEYDLIWELRKDDGDVVFHCTKVLVTETC